MGLFKHRRKKAESSNSDAKPRRRWLGEFLGRSHIEASESSHVAEDPSGHGSVDPVFTSSPPSNPEGSATNPSLWGRAFDALRLDDPDLVDEYEKLLSNEAQKTSAHHFRVTHSN